MGHALAPRSLPNTHFVCGRLVVAISRTNAPIGVGTDGWYSYSFEMVQDAGTVNEAFLITMTSATATQCSTSVEINSPTPHSAGVEWSSGTRLRSMPRLPHSAAITSISTTQMARQCVCLAVKQQNAYSGTAIFVNSRRTGGNKLTKWVISDPFGANTRVGTDIAVADYAVPPDAIQPSGGTLDTIDSMLMTATIVNDNHNGTGTMLLNRPECIQSLGWRYRCSISCPHLSHQLRTIPVLLDRNFGAVGFYYWFPSVAADYQDTALWVFTRCGPAAGQFPEARYVGWEAGAFVNSSTQLEAGTGSYSGFRWGRLLRCLTRLGRLQFQHHQQESHLDERHARHCWRMGCPHWLDQHVHTRQSGCLSRWTHR